MPTRIGISGFGRMGRLALRAGWGRPDLEFVHINEVLGGTETAAHLLTFDSVHGRWNHRVDAGDDRIAIDGTIVTFSAAAKPDAVPWSNQQVDIVLECSGKFRTTEDDARSAIVDALSTMVVDGTCVKVLAWYDNEIGYVNRMVELTQKVGASL